MVMAPHNSLSLYLIMVMLLFMTTPCLTKQKGEGATESEKRYLQMCPNQVMGIYLTSYSIFSVDLNSDQNEGTIKDYRIPNKQHYRYFIVFILS